MYTYPRLENLAYPARVLSDEGPLSRSDPSADRTRAGRTGAPGRSMAWWPVERWEALRLALGARGALPREVGSPPASRVSHWASWRLPPLHRLARFARNWQTSDALRRENAAAWLFESMNQKLRQSAFLTSPRSFAGRGRRASSDARRVRGQALSTPDQKPIR